MTSARSINGFFSASIVFHRFSNCMISFLPKTLFTCRIT
jgi:hypothetical protein